MLIREIQTTDAESFLNLCKSLDDETKLMLLEPGERTTMVEQIRGQIEWYLSRNNSIILVAVDDGELVGYLRAKGGDYARNKHCVHIDCGVRQAFAGQGIGTSLFIELESWARERGIHRLELTTMTHNKRAIALYTRMGFEIEGVKKHSFLIDGSYVDDYYMGKLLPQDS